ncbi:ANTAR domain-containing protein [Arthrobacter pigmenti]
MDRELQMRLDAALAAAQARKIDQLCGSMSHRELIGQAAGILIERYNLSPEQACSFLIRASQDTNMKLSTVADRLVRTGEFNL